MTDLFEFAEAKRRREAGMSLAATAQGQRWCDLAYAAIDAIARRQFHIHIDDVLCVGIPQPEHFNSWGAVWMRAIRNGIIQRTTETRPCTVDPGKNAHRYPVYFSRIYDPRCPK